MNIKELFDNAENGALTFEQFEAVAKEKGYKLADLSDGKYVSKSKYDSDIKAVNTQMDALNEQITNLNGTITTRDADLETLKKQLEDAGKDADKIAELGTSLSNLQAKYDQDVKSYQEQMAQQSYEFAVKDFASTKKFTSNAAKRDFTRAMIDRKLQMENGVLIGGEDFVKIYSEENSDAFLVETPKVEEPKPKTEEPKPQPKADPIPTFVAPTGGAQQSSDSNDFSFNFTGVRAHK